MVDPKATLLIVEDDIFTRTSMTAYLTAEGYAVNKAGSGVEALEGIRLHEPDLVITDLRMPEMGGLELLKKLKEDIPQLPVIIISGEGTMGSVIEALQFGARDYLQKPIQDMGLLKHSIELALSHASLKKAHDMYREDLEWLVEKRTQELSDKNEELIETVKQRKLAESQLLQAQKLESVGQLAAGIAHEINTPTQFVSSNVDFLEESFTEMVELLNGCWDVLQLFKKGEATKEQVAKLEELADELDWEYLKEEIPVAIKQSRDGVKRIATIVTAMKEFSHPGSRSKTDVDLNKIIDTTITVARNEWKYVAQMETDLDENLLPVHCLADEIGQVFLNMIVNAAHAIEAKLGENPEGEKGRIVISTRQGDGFAEIRVADSGSGVPKHAQHRIFDPFYTTKNVGKGTGQGLAIVHSVITSKHDGTISFTTEENVGTTFVITLPQN
ncbi:response regulator [Desulforhopalus sp. 52FAK]